MEELGRPLRFTADWGWPTSTGSSGGWPTTSTPGWRSGLIVHRHEPGTGSTPLRRSPRVRRTSRSPRPPSSLFEVQRGARPVRGPTPPGRSGRLPCCYYDAILIAVADESPIRDSATSCGWSCPFGSRSCWMTAPATPAGACRVLLDEYGLTRDVVDGLGGSMVYREFSLRRPRCSLPATPTW